MILCRIRCSFKLSLKLDTLFLSIIYLNLATGQVFVFDCCVCYLDLATGQVFDSDCCVCYDGVTSVTFCDVCYSVSVPSFSTLIFHDFHDQKLRKSITYRHWIGDSCGLSATLCDCRWQKIGYFLKVLARLSAIQHIVNHRFYITINNLCN